VKVWDLRQGHILYTLYGHEGSTNSVQFSPSGDYFTSGGNDSVVMIWKSNLNQFEQELIDDFGGKTSITTPVDDKPPTSGVVKPAAVSGRP